MNDWTLPGCWLIVHLPYDDYRKKDLPEVVAWLENAYNGKSFNGRYKNSVAFGKCLEEARYQL